MAKFFKGLASSGAWACFDEFNRIDIEVLSVIAQQISTIQKAVAAGMTKFVFEGVELRLDPTNAIFITMNPGYAGRTELPDNLKALFRPVAMMIPDYAMIGEISLFSFGFSDAKKLAQKMVATFKLSSEQLSSQDHYDFGMRAVKTVISAAGILKRCFPKQSEDRLLLQALCEVNVPKFLSEDVPLFQGIVADLFPEVPYAKVNNEKLHESIRNTCENTQILPISGFVEKCLQMYDTINVRHGMMLVGPAGGGKTTCYRTLQLALPQAGICKVQLRALNPKSITMGQLYGEFDNQTHEWSDGVLSSMVREGASDESDDRKWYIFDGPVDAVWIESMNTVLDDNKKLCLTSGEIIKLSNSQTLIFEVDNLTYASPATVSRCGMVYLEPGGLGLLPLVRSWGMVRSMQKDSMDKIEQLFENICFGAIQFVRKSMKEIVPTTDSGLVKSCLNLMGSMIDRLYGLQAVGIDATVVENVFYFSLIWSVGATGDAFSRLKFSSWLESVVPSLPRGKEGAIVHDYKFDLELLTWTPWVVDTFQNSSALVPTLDTVRNSFLFDLLIHTSHPFLCSGPTGTGKSSSIVSKLLNDLDRSFSPLIVNFSARTSANQTQDILDSRMDKRRKGPFIDKLRFLYRFKLPG
jgi:dynein heavy chain